jgi:hypothetical protein
MSEAPLEWPATAYILHPSVQTYGELVSNPERRKYIRADLVEAAIKRALEGAANMIRDGMDDSEWYNPVRAIRAIDPAQFIEEPKG